MLIIPNEQYFPKGIIKKIVLFSAAHLVKCKRISAFPVENVGPSGMLDSLGLVPKSASEVR